MLPNITIPRLGEGATEVVLALLIVGAVWFIVWAAPQVRRGDDYASVSEWRQVRRARRELGAGMTTAPTLVRHELFLVSYWRRARERGPRYLAATVGIWVLLVAGVVVGVTNLEGARTGSQTPATPTPSSTTAPETVDL